MPKYKVTITRVHETEVHAADDDQAVNIVHEASQPYRETIERITEIRAQLIEEEKPCQDS